MAPKLLNPLCCLRANSSDLQLHLVVLPLKNFPLGHLPDAVIYKILAKMPFELVTRMLRTCSRLHYIGESSKETIFAQPETGILLNFKVSRDNVTAVIGTDIFEPGQDYNDLRKALEGFTLATISVFNHGHDCDADTVREFFAELGLTCRKLCANHKGSVSYIPLSDLITWRSMEMSFQCFGDEEAEDLVLFLQNLEKEKNSDLFELKIVNFPAGHFYILPQNILRHFRSVEFRTLYLGSYPDWDPRWEFTWREYILCTIPYMIGSSFRKLWAKFH